MDSMFRVLNNRNFENILQLIQTVDIADFVQFFDIIILAPCKIPNKRFDKFLTEGNGNVFN